MEISKKILYIISYLGLSFLSYIFIITNERNEIVRVIIALAFPIGVIFVLFILIGSLLFYYNFWKENIGANIVFLICGYILSELIIMVYHLKTYQKRGLVWVIFFYLVNYFAIFFTAGIVRYAGIFITNLNFDISDKVLNKFIALVFLTLICVITFVFLFFDGF